MATANVQFHDGHADQPDFLAAVRAGLAASPKSISSKFFYDDEGLDIFDAICRLPEYYLTRTEIDILRTRAGEIAGLAGPGGVLIELGSGAIEKVRLLLDMIRPEAYLAIDICREFLKQATARLARDYPWLEVHAACADLTQPFELSYPPAGLKRLLFYPGSSVGNFDPDEVVALLARLRPLAGPEGGLVIGVDLKKDPRILRAAYNDRAGVTAAFNLNLLRRIRDELGAELDLDEFAHEALYNEARGRIEMYLVSRRNQSLIVGGQQYRFAEGERLHTENSYKYTIAEFQRLARRAGYRPVAEWTDARASFSVHYLVNANSSGTKL